MKQAFEKLQNAFILVGKTARMTPLVELDESERKSKIGPWPLGRMWPS
jgi:hypothetical protein